MASNQRKPYEVLIIQGKPPSPNLEKVEKIKPSKFVSYAQFFSNEMLPEAKKKLCDLRKELKMIEADNELSMGEKSIKSNYIKAEISDIKEGPNYVPYSYKIGEIDTFNYEFSDRIAKLLEDELKLSKEKWEETQNWREEYYCNKFQNEILDISPQNILYVHGGTIRCIRDRHTVRSIRANIKSIMGDYQINAMHCDDCGLNFISNLEWKYYTQLHGNLIANFRWISDNGEPNDTVELKVPHNKSILYLCGYNVNAYVGMDEKERQLILKQILDNGILEKHQIIGYLNYFLTTNGKIKNHEAAKRKWQDDLEFVRNFDFQNQNEIEIFKVEKYNP